MVGEYCNCTVRVVIIIIVILIIIVTLIMKNNIVLEYKQCQMFNYICAGSHTVHVVTICPKGKHQRLVFFAPCDYLPMNWIVFLQSLGEGGLLYKVLIQGGCTSRYNPYPFIYHFWQKRHTFHFYSLLKKGTLYTYLPKFHITWKHPML